MARKKIITNKPEVQKTFSKPKKGKKAVKPEKLVVRSRK